MLSNEEFIRQSIDLNLFFMRIMKEHMFFIEVAFTPKNQNLSRESDRLKNEANRVLTETLSISNGFVSPQVAASGELVTKFTLQAEQATSYYTGVNIDSRLTQAQRGLVGAAEARMDSRILEMVTRINHRAINVVKSIISFKENLLKDVLSCKIFTLNYPLLIDHILREAKLYLSLLNKLQGKEVIDSEKDLLDYQVFWNRIMAEHAKFIRGLLDPTEVDLFNTANMFGNTFDKLTIEAKEAQRKTEILPSITMKSLKETTEIRDFKSQGTEGILSCKVKSIILPLLGDHTLREANHYLRLLKIFDKNHK